MTVSVTNDLSTLNFLTGNWDSNKRS